ncbi:hypothetical protein MPH_11227 [Macrophomina phaseolina MS6]|uniref:Uncharacterized protein n=1 Tax=Macrophomina phaseolina (strain MS6) TaxID=1126212 RepID=K2RNG1_MACPH|nr:hypothetical protein MPH_11227 [Macrophomina phaseolina MS6]
MARYPGLFAALIGIVAAAADSPARNDTVPETRILTPSAASSPAAQSTSSSSAELPAAIFPPAPSGALPTTLLIDTRPVPGSSASSSTALPGEILPPSGSLPTTLVIDTSPPVPSSSGGLLIDTNPPPTPSKASSSSAGGLLIDTSPPPTVTVTAPGNATITGAPATGSGFSYAKSCNDAHIAWTQSYYNWQGTSYYETTGFAVQMTASVQNLSASACSTLCDNYPRCAGSPSRTEYYLTLPYTYTTYAGAFTQAEPSCSISPSDCVSLVSSWFSVESAVESSISSFELAGQSVPYGSFLSILPKQIPQCTTDATWSWTEALSGLGQNKKRAAAPTPPQRESFTKPTITPAPKVRATDLFKDYRPELHRRAQTVDWCQSCLLDADAVRLLYWPVTRVGGLCDANRTYITGHPTISGQPNTVLWSGTTLTSPSVYLSFSNLNVFNCPRSGTQEILAMDPSALSSERFPMQSIYPFNFDDMNTPVPLDAYKGQAMCWATWNNLATDACSTIWDDYNPWISMPTSMVIQMDPAWTGCTTFGLDLPVYDPPIPLTTAGALFGTTTTEEPQPETTSAKPSSSPTDPNPSPTHTAVPVTITSAQPVTSQDPGKPQNTGEPPSNSDPPSSADPPNNADPSNNAPPSNSNSADPAPQQTSTSNGGGLAPIISQIVSAINGGDPPQATSDSDPQDPTSTESDNNNPAPSQNTPAPAPTLIATVGTQVISADPSNPSGIIVGGAPLAPGQATTIGGIPVSVAPSAVVVGGQGPAAPSTIVIPAPPQPAPSGALATVGGQPVTPDASQPGHVVIGSQTLAPGAQTVIAGTPISVGSSVVIIAGSALALPPAAAAPTATPLTTINGQPILVDPSDLSAIIVAGQTLRAGDPALTLSNTPVSLAPGALIIGSTATLALPTTAAAAAATASITTAPTAAQGALLTLAGETLTAFQAGSSSGGVIVVAGTTLTPGGPAATIAGTVVSAAASALVVNGQTLAYSAVPQTSGVVEALITPADGGAVVTATRY